MGDDPRNREHFWLQRAWRLRLASVVTKDGRKKSEWIRSVVIEAIKAAEVPPAKK